MMEVFRYVDRLVSIVRPRKMIFMAVGLHGPGRPACCTLYTSCAYACAFSLSCGRVRSIESASHHHPEKVPNTEPRKALTRSQQGKIRRILISETLTSIYRVNSRVSRRSRPERGKERGRRRLRRLSSAVDRRILSLPPHGCLQLTRSCSSLGTPAVRCRRNCAACEDQPAAQPSLPGGARPPEGSHRGAREPARAWQGNHCQGRPTEV